MDADDVLSDPTPTLGQVAFVALTDSRIDPNERVTPRGLPEPAMLAFLDTLGADLGPHVAAIRYTLEATPPSQLWFPIPTTRNGGNDGTAIFDLDGIHGTRPGSPRAASAP